MSDWTSGYVADIAYTYGYYSELNPLRARLALLNSGIVCPEFGTACELGFGQGLSTNFHAAASNSEWLGTDFNPAQAGFAQELAKISGAKVSHFDDAFADFCNRATLPDFDFIGLHGIWSWISDGNRQIITDFVRRKLKVGGVLYISYNTLPGWSTFAPMRHLLAQHAEIIGTAGHGIFSRVDGALNFADKLIETNPNYARVNPQVKQRLGKMKAQNRNYLAHEYFNKDWHPMHFATMREWLEPAKVNYACSAHYLDHVPSVNLTADQLAFMKEIPDAMLRQSVYDFMVNRQFRKDYWIKGARRLSTFEQTELLGAERVVLITHRPDVSLKVTGSLGEASMSENIYNPVLEVLADHQPRSLAEIHALVRTHNITFGQLIQAVLVLASSGQVSSAQEEGRIATLKKKTDRLNKYIVAKARDNGDIAYLVSPVTAGGVSVPRFPQLFLREMQNGEKSAPAWAKSALEIITRQGQSVLKDGKELTSGEEILAELTKQAQAFEEKMLPILKALKIV